jgi:hypothetical protein
MEGWTTGSIERVSAILHHSSTPLLHSSDTPLLQYSITPVRFLMLKFRESLVSAHHNYLVNQILSPGFSAGNPDSKDDFFFLADVVRHGESEPKIYARVYDIQGAFILEMEPRRIVENPLGCVRHSFPGGYRIVLPSGEALLSVQTESFANGFLTRIQGKLYDREGKLRIEPYFDAIQIHGDALLTLSTPCK